MNDLAIFIFNNQLIISYYIKLSEIIFFEFKVSHKFSINFGNLPEFCLICIKFDFQ